MKTNMKMRECIALLAVIALSTGCLGIVKNRTPKIPKRQRNVQVEKIPVIDLDLEYRVHTERFYEEGSHEFVCTKQREAIAKVVSEFDFLAGASEEPEEPDYRLVVQADWTADYMFDHPGSEGCMYAMAMFMPCISKDRLETSAELLRPGGEVIARAEASAERRFITHFTGTWLFPAVFPSLPAYLRFSTNTYRNLFPQIGRHLAQGGTAHERGRDDLLDGPVDRRAMGHPSGRLPHEGS